MSAIPITTGTGSASVATETVGGVSYQQVEIYGAGGASVLAVNPDGSFNASIIGVPKVSFSGAPSISGTVNIGTQSGSVVSFQGTNPWIITGSVQGSFSGGNSSVQLLVGSAVIGSVAALQGTNPWIITGSVQATAAANQSVSGTVNTLPLGTIVTSLVSTIPSSVIVGSSIFGQLPGGTATLGSIAALQGTNPWVIVGSVYGAGSVVAFQGAGWSGSVAATITNTNVNVSGSVVSFQGAGWSTSMVGAPIKADNSAWTEGDIGIYALKVRNDTLSSVSAANVRYSPGTVGPVGEQITANAPITKWVQGTADFRTNSGASIAVIAAQGASVFTYVTGIQIANMGSASVLVTLSGATSSIIGYTIAPAGGGSNIVYPNALKTNANADFSASISGVSSVLVSAQGFISKT